MSFGRPLGQCCRNSRQHCTGLALRTPGSPLRCLHVREPVPRHAVSFQQSPARAHARAERAPSHAHAVAARALDAAPHRKHRARLTPRHTAPSERSRAAAEREPSAMLPAVSAALAERSRGGAARFASALRTEPLNHGIREPPPYARNSRPRIATNRLGTTNNVIGVDNARPPITASANGR
jgi:hypothetical protein